MDSKQPITLQSQNTISQNSQDAVCVCGFSYDVLHKSYYTELSLMSHKEHTDSK